MSLRLNEVVGAAAQRWREAAALLSCASRAPDSALLWLGPAWTGPAAQAYGKWASGFEQASLRAAGALRAAADSLLALSSSWPEPRLMNALTETANAVAEILSVPVPGAAKLPTQAPDQETAIPANEPAHQPNSEGTKQPETGEKPEVPATTGRARDAQVRQWIDQAIQILLAHGYKPEQMDPDAIATIIKHESSGNPRAVNNWDSNAARGTPSMGLMQTIAPTFARWHLPGHDQIFDPVDNIIAGVRYAIARYGSVSRVPGLLSLAAGEGYRGY